MRMGFANTGEHDSQPLSSGATPIVFVIDDDVSMRESLELLISSAGWQPKTFETAQAFLSRPRVLAPSCLILDVTLPDLNGLDLQRRVAAEEANMPIIFISGHGDVATTVQAMKSGAIDFFCETFQCRCAAMRDQKCRGTQRSDAPRRRRAAVVAGAVRNLESARTGSHDPRCSGLVEQAGRFRTGYQRDNGQGTPGTRDAKNAGRLTCRIGRHGEETPRCALAAKIDAHDGFTGTLRSARKKAPADAGGPRRTAQVIAKSE